MVKMVLSANPVERFADEMFGPKGGEKWAGQVTFADGVLVYP